MLHLKNFGRGWALLHVSFHISVVLVVMVIIFVVTERPFLEKVSDLALIAKFKGFLIVLHGSAAGQDVVGWVFLYDYGLVVV